jgi:hypothetical protein
MPIEVHRIDATSAWAEARPLLRAMGLVCLGTGVVLLAAATYTAAHTYRTIGAWVPVPALVLQFQLVNEPTGRVRTSYRAHFTFQYEVAGQVLVSATRSAYTTASASALRDWALHYRPGSRQQIRYNPAHPSEITIDNLDLRSFRHSLGLGAWGGGLLVLGLVLRREPSRAA